MNQRSAPPQQRIVTESKSVQKPKLQDQLSRFPASFGLIGFTLLIYIAQEMSLFLTGTDFVISYGAKINEAIYAGQLWRFITPIFVHAGIWHIFVNMYSLYALGPTVESFFNTPRMLVIYFLSGICSVVFSLAFSAYASVGASGAIFGLLGSLGTFLYLHRESLGQAGKAYLQRIAIVAILNLALGFAPNIDNWGHLGGLLAGIALTWFLGPRFEARWSSDEESVKLVELRPWGDIWRRVIPAAFVLIFLAYLAMLSPLS